MPKLTGSALGIAKSKDPTTRLQVLTLTTSAWGAGQPLLLRVDNTDPGGAAGAATILPFGWDFCSW